MELRHEGEDIRAEGYTIATSSKGCMVVMPQCVPVGEKVRLVNLINQISCEAIRVWRGHQGRMGWELGLELQEAAYDFWGLDFRTVSIGLFASLWRNRQRVFHSGRRKGVHLFLSALFPCQ
jgi:hypothetical protein